MKISIDKNIIKSEIEKAVDRMFNYEYSNWFINIYVNCDGTIWSTDIMSNDSWLPKIDSYCVASIGSWNVDSTEEYNKKKEILINNHLINIDTYDHIMFDVYGLEFEIIN